MAAFKNVMPAGSAMTKYLAMLLYIKRSQTAAGD